MKFKVYFVWPNNSEDEVTLEADSTEDMNRDWINFCEQRRLNPEKAYMFSEEVR